MRQLEVDGPGAEHDEGEFEAATWDQAWQAIYERWTEFHERHGREALGIYVGNPNAHNRGSMLWLRSLIRGLGTKPVPDVDRIDLPRLLAGSTPRPPVKTNSCWWGAATFATTTRGCTTSGGGEHPPRLGDTTTPPPA